VFTGPLTSPGERALLDVFQPLCEQLDDVVVVEGVEHHLSGAPRPHEPLIPQQAQLVRDRGFAQAQKLGNIADTQLGSGEGVQDPHAGHVSEHPEGVGK